jgi:mannose-6-phosphate isomerase-like protein (cupin superfamily)
VFLMARSCHALTMSLIHEIGLGSRRQGEGEAFWVLGDRYELKLSAEESMGSTAIVELTSFPKNGPPPHIHRREDEAFYVLDGAFSVLLGGRSFEVSAGDFVYIPRGALHTYKNVGSSLGRFLVILTPGGLENLLREIGEPARQEPVSRAAADRTIEKLIALAPKYHLEIPRADVDLDCEAR